MAGRKTIKEFNEWDLSEGIKGKCLKYIKTNYRRALRRVKNKEAKKESKEYYEQITR